MLQCANHTHLSLSLSLSPLPPHGATSLFSHECTLPLLSLSFSLSLSLSLFLSLSLSFASSFLAQKQHLSFSLSFNPSLFISLSHFPSTTLPFFFSSLYSITSLHTHTHTDTHTHTHRDHFSAQSPFTVSQGTLGRHSYWEVSISFFLSHTHTHTHTQTETHTRAHVRMCLAQTCLLFLVER